MRIFFLSLVAVALLAAGISRLDSPSSAIDTQSTPSLASSNFRPGDVGFSLYNKYGHVWLYGDSWYRGRFIRSAVTVNGRYTGFLAGVKRGNWIWPGAPWNLPDGRIMMYASENKTPSGKGPWQRSFVRGLRVVFDPRYPGRAKVYPTPGTVWSADAVRWRGQLYLYSVNSRYQAYVAKTSATGVVQSTRKLGGFLGGHFSVVQDSKKRWWMVGLGGMLSRRLWAHRLESPWGPIISKPVLLATLPKPGLKRFTYAADVHTELGGLLTWAVNGTGPGTPYGLQKRPGWWPGALKRALGKRY